MLKTKLPPIHPGEILLEEFLKPMEISETDTPLKSTSHYKRLKRLFKARPLLPPISL